jgi:hypothetical protein
MVLGGLFFAAFAAVLALRASTNQRGLVINHVVHLEPGAATTLYWVMVVLSALFVVLAAATALQRTRELTLDDRSVAIPGPIWRRAPVTIAFADITALEQQAIHGQDLLILVHRRGRAAIARISVGDAAFAEITARLAAQVRPRAA